MVVYKFGLSNHTLITKWPFIHGLQNFYGISLNGAYGIAVGYTSSQSTVYTVDLVNLKMYSNVTVNKSLGSESVLYSSPLLLNTNPNDPVSLGGFVFGHEEGGISKAVYFGLDGTYEVVNSSISFFGTGANSFTVYQDRPEQENNYVITALYYEVLSNDEEEFLVD